MPLNESHNASFDALVQTFEEFMTKHDFAPIEGSRHELGIGAWQDFSNYSFLIRIALDRGDPIINVSKAGVPDWLLAERLLSYFAEDDTWRPWDVERIAGEMDRRYDAMDGFLGGEGYEERRRAFSKFALEAVARAHPHWNIEKTDRWKALHPED